LARTPRLSQGRVPAQRRDLVFIGGEPDQEGADGCRRIAPAQTFKQPNASSINVTASNAAQPRIRAAHRSDPPPDPVAAQLVEHYRPDPPDRLGALPQRKKCPA